MTKESAVALTSGGAGTDARTTRGLAADARRYLVLSEAPAA
ncbi:MAG TPA: hypothetical protein VIF88_02475 [Methylocystis sp.]